MVISPRQALILRKVVESYLASGLPVGSKALAGDRMVLGYGGTQSIDTPSGYGAVSMGLLKELGIDV